MSHTNRVILVCIINYGAVWESVPISYSRLFRHNFILKEDREILLCVWQGVHINLLMYA